MARSMTIQFGAFTGAEARESLRTMGTTSDTYGDRIALLRIIEFEEKSGVKFVRDDDGYIRVARA